MLLYLIKRFFRPASTPRRILLVLFWTFLLNVCFGTAFYFAERGVQDGLGLLDGIWWAMVTMTTVGYGDYYAQTAMGRFLVSYPTFLLGIGLLGYFLGTVADAVIEGASARRKGLLKIMKTDHLIICGYPSPSKVLQIVRELRVLPKYSDAAFVLISARIKEIPEDLAAANIHFVHGSPRSETILRKAGIERCQGAFVLAESQDEEDTDAQTFTTCALIESIAKEVGREIHVVSELISRQNFGMIRRAGTGGIVAQEGITDCLLVQEFLSPGVSTIFHQIITNQVGSQFHVLPTRLIGKKVRDIQIAALEHPNNMQIIGLVQKGEFILNPSHQHVIGTDERLIILAEDAADFEDVERSILNDPQASTEQETVNYS